MPGVYLLGVGLVIMLAGLLFGYDQGVISGALDGIQKQFSVGTFLLEVITSWVTLGAMAGALVAGGLADRMGRRWTIVFAAGSGHFTSSSSRFCAIVVQPAVR